MREYRLFHELKNGYRVLSTYGRKIFEKVVEAVALLEVIDQGLYRYSCARENNGAAHYFV